MENQESPATDQDVIDWILDNLIEKTRTRRGVIKKLKELGLIFKAPTKRSTAAAANKNLFTKDEDDTLRELYEEHRLDEHCLNKIMEVFNKKRSKKAVVKRMVQLGIVADETEILPARKQKKRKEEQRGRSGSSSSASDSDEDRQASPQRQTIKHYQLSQREANVLRNELEESMREAIDWVIESFNEAADDFEEPSEDPDDAIPIVPFSESQKAAMENPQFKKLLASVNLQEPHGLESYWKIPANMMPDELRRRAKVLAGEEIVESAQEAASSDDDDLFTRLRAQRDALVYNQSDDEPDRPAPVKKLVEKVVPHDRKPNTKVVNKLLPQISKNFGDSLKWVVGSLKDKAENKSSDGVDELFLTPSTAVHKAALDDGNFQQLLVAVNMIPPDGAESFWRFPQSLNAKGLIKRAELLVLPEESSDDEEQQMVIKRKKKKPVMHESDGLNINTQEIKQRLAELSDSSNDDHNQSLQKSKRNVLESSDEEEVTSTKTSGKRDRSEIADDTPDENDVNATNNQTKRVRRIADSSDDD